MFQQRIMPETFLKHRFIPYVGILNDELSIDREALDNSDDGDFFCKAWNLSLCGDSGFYCLHVGYQEIFIESSLADNSDYTELSIDAGSDLEKQCKYDDQGRFITPGDKTELIIIANHFCIMLKEQEPQKCIIQTTKTFEIEESRAWNNEVQDNPFCSHWYNLTSRVDSVPGTKGKGHRLVYSIPYSANPSGDADYGQREKFYELYEHRYEHRSNYKQIINEAKEYSDFLKSGGMDNFLSKLSFWGKNYIKNIFNKP